MSKSKEEILSGVEFIEPIINDTRSEIEFKYRLDLRKHHIKGLPLEAPGFSRLIALTLSNNINKFLIETGKFQSIRVTSFECELKHCMDIPSKRWGERQWLVKIVVDKRIIYIDALASRLYDLDDYMPDVYIGECLPPYAKSMETKAWYWKGPIRYELEFTLRGKICDWLATKIFKVR